MSNLFKSTVIVMLLTGVSKVVGLLRETTMASAYGISESMDAFLVAVLLPQFIASMMQSGVNKVFVSMYNETQSKGGDTAATAFTKTLFLLTLCCGFILYFILNNTSVQLLQMLVPGFSVEKLGITMKLLEIMMPCFILMISTDILNAYHQVKGQFAYATSGPIILNIVTIFLVGIFATSDGILTAAYAYLLSAVIQFFLLLFGSFRNGLWKELTFSIQVKEIKKFGLLILPILASIAFSQTNTVIDRMFASGLSEGSISALNYGYKIYWLIIALFVIPFSTTFFPALAELYNKERAQFNTKVRRVLSLLLFLALPITIFAIVLAKPMISLIFQRGAFQLAAVEITSEILICYLMGLVFQVVVLLLLDVAYVMQKTGIAVVIAVTMTICNVTLNYLTVHILAATGLAIATSVSQFIGCVLLYSVMVKGYKVFDVPFLITELVKILGLCIVPGLLLIGWRDLTIVYAIRPLVCVGVGMGIFVSSFVICARISNRVEIIDIIAVIKKKPIFRQLKSFLCVGGRE